MQRDHWSTRVFADKELMAYLGSMETTENDLAEASPANEEE